MSCPDWRTLSQRRQDDPGESSEWRSALEHLEACDACLADAPAFEPTLLFQRLPALEVDADGIESMKQAVASMRRGETIERRRRRLPSAWLRAAAVAVVVFGSLLLRGAGSAPEAATPPAIGAAGVAAATEIDLRGMPLVETVDPSYGSIIQVVDDDISVVLVMASELGV